MISGDLYIYNLYVQRKIFSSTSGYSIEMHGQQAGRGGIQTNVAAGIIKAIARSGK